MVLGADARLLDDKTHGVRRSLRRVRHTRGQQKNIALPNVDVVRVAVLHDLEDDVALDLVKQLFAGVDVVIAALVRPTDYHDQKAAIPETRIAYRRLKQVPVFLYPRFEIQRRQARHEGSLPRNSNAIRPPGT